MRKLCGCLLLFAFVSCQKNAWSPAPAPLMTPWARQVRAEKPWPDYPRPNMTRSDWKSLNGLWDYAILPLQEAMPGAWQGKILVPFCVESALSGVGKKVGDQHKLWYKTEFEVPAAWKNRQILLHFEAVDWETNLWINGQKAGGHRGGFDPFVFNISRWLKPGRNEIILSVYDPTDKGWQAVGKQVQNPGGIFYTSVTGIWQTVWLEPVPDAYITDFHCFPDIDRAQVRIETATHLAGMEDEIQAEVYLRGKLMGRARARNGDDLRLDIPQPLLWSPETPVLYDLSLTLFRQGKPVDAVGGYFGMRKISIGKDSTGTTRILLNNRFVFQQGPLDQGFWPDGIYTAPNEKAMRYDLEMVRKMGFNMLRKHVKVEPRRFYYWCDRLGILVWQDMPNGDQRLDPGVPDLQRSPESARQFEAELRQLIRHRFNHPSIVMWVPFNEGWGQFDTERIVKMVKSADPTRLVNNASGWTDRKCGDVLDWHRYPEPAYPPAEAKRAAVLGEFGGLGLAFEAHLWEKQFWGYSQFHDPNLLLATYEQYFADIYQKGVPGGLSAAVYTQLTDVETEANGLLTYDRKVLKMPLEDLLLIHSGRFMVAPRVSPAGGILQAGDSVRLEAGAGVQIRYTLDGSEPDEKSALYTRPIPISKNLTLRARAYAGAQRSRILETKYQVSNKVRPQYTYLFHEKYPGGGFYGLMDEQNGSEQFADGHWQGFSGVDLEVVLPVEESGKLLSGLGISFLEDSRAWIFPPESVEIYSSLDGSLFEPVKEISLEQPEGPRPARIQHLQVDFLPHSSRFIKIRARNIGVCPDWHPASGKPAWLFVDEVRLNLRKK